MYGGKNTPLTSVLVASIVVGLVAGGVLAGHPDRAAASQSSGGSTLVVDADGGADYRSIHAAIENASAGDTVEVRPGTYEEQVIVNKSVTVVAPDGATLDGTALPGRAWGFVINERDATVVVDGLTITNFFVGVHALETTGDWTIRNATIRDNRDDGIEAGRSTGAWTLRNVTLANNNEGIDAENTTGAWTVRNAVIQGNQDDGLDVDGPRTSGDWTIRNSTIRRSGDDGIDTDSGSNDWTIRGTTISSNRNGVQVMDGTGDWTIRDSVIRNNTGYGVYATRAGGNWTIRNSHLRYNVITAVFASENTGAWTIRNATIHHTRIGVFANASTGAWTIRDSWIRNTTIPEFYLKGQGTGIYATQSTGAWAVHHTNLADHGTHAINASGASTEGDATRNWWGRADGPADGDCVGNVDCGDALSEPAHVAEPPTVSSGFDADAVSKEGEFGLLSMAIVAVLLVVVTVLGVLAWRYT